MTAFHTLVLCLVLPYLVSADIKFVYPSGGEVINASSTSTINTEWCESNLTPLIPALYNYTIRLYTSSGLNSTPSLVPASILNPDGPMPGFAGNGTSPQTAVDAIQIQGLNLDTLNSVPNSYFFGVASKFRPLANGTDPGIMELTFSPRFSLSSASVAIDPNNPAKIPVQAPERLFFCTGSQDACTPPVDLVAPIVVQPPINYAEEEKRRLNRFVAGYLATAFSWMGTVLILIYVLRNTRRDSMFVLEDGMVEDRDAKAGFRKRVRGMGAGLAGSRVAAYEKWSFKRTNDSEKGLEGGQG